MDEERVKWEHLGHLALSYSFIGVALVIKVFHIPERWFPKTFDMFGASHQLFHLITTTGAIISHEYVMSMLRNGSFPSVWGSAGRS
jgi:adiponectin receptor